MEGGVERVRRQCAGIFPIEFDQGVDQVVGVRVARREIIGLELIAALDVGHDRLEEYREDRRNQHEQQQRGRVGSPWNAQASVEPVLLADPAQQRKTGQGDSRTGCQHFDDMATLEMTEFMREHGFQFVMPQRVDESVEEHDAFAVADTREIGIAMSRAAGAVHDENALAVEAATLQQCLDTLAEAEVGQRGEFVEQRRNQGGISPAHQDGERHQDRPGPQPPVRAGGIHDPEYQGQQRCSKGQAQQGLHGQILGELERGVAVEAVALLDHESLVDGDGQFDQLQDQERAEDQPDARHQWRPTHALPGAAYCRDTATQREQEEDCHTQRTVDISQTAFIDGIVRRLAVSLQGDLMLESRRNRVAMCGYMCRLTA